MELSPAGACKEEEGAQKRDSGEGGEVFIVSIVGDEGISHLKHLRHLQSGPHPSESADALELRNIHILYTG